MRKFLVFFFIMVNGIIFAEKQDLKFSLASDSSLFFKLPTGAEIQFEYDKKWGADLNVEWVSVDLENHIVQSVRGESGEIKIEVSQANPSQTPLKLKVSVGQSLPLTLISQKAKVKVQNWQGPGWVNLQEGRFQSTSVKGDWEVFVKKGSVDVTRHEGRLQLDSFQGHSVKVSQLKGALIAENFKGNTTFENITGSVDFKSFMGKFHLDQVAGAVNYKSEVTTGVLKNISGSGVISTNSGNLKIYVTDKSQFHLTSQTGVLTIHSNRIKTKYNLKVKKKGWVYSSLSMALSNYQQWVRYKGATASGRGGAMVSALSRSGKIYVR